jgi:hypothetical protein
MAVPFYFHMNVIIHSSNDHHQSYIYVAPFTIIIIIIIIITMPYQHPTVVCISVIMESAYAIARRNLLMKQYSYHVCVGDPLFITDFESVSSTN